MKYRNCLHSALNLDPFEVPKYKSFFKRYAKLFIQKSYGSERERLFQNEQKNAYLEHHEHDNVFNIEHPHKMREILRLYANESYFYRALNTKLRTFDCFEELRKVGLPFYELYHSISVYYHQVKQIHKDSEEKLRDLTVYRGLVMSEKEYNLLEEGDYIETTSFLSASEDRQVAIDVFSNREKTAQRYLMCIEIPCQKYSEEAERYDGGGYVEFSEVFGDEGNDRMKKEKEVLFNPLNIFKVERKYEEIIESMEDEQKVSCRYKVIWLRYGAVRDLVDSDSKTKEEESLLNIVKKLKSCEKGFDQGDLFVENKKYNEAIQFYEEAIQNYSNPRKEEEKAEFKKKEAGFVYKLSETYRRKKDMRKAQEQLDKFLSKEENIDMEDRDKAMEYYAFHVKNIQIKL